MLSPVLSVTVHPAEPTGESVPVPTPIGTTETIAVLNLMMS